jgi:hypothetical protein
VTWLIRASPYGDRRPLWERPLARRWPFPNGQRFHHGFVIAGQWFHLCFVALKEFLVPATLAVPIVHLGVIGMFDIYFKERTSF